MDLKHSDDWPLIEALAEEVREILSEQGKCIFDVLWRERPQEPKALWEALRKRGFPDIQMEGTPTAVSKVRKKLSNFFKGSRGIGRKYRLSVTEGAMNRSPSLEVELNKHTGALAFWLGHLQNDRRTCLVLGRPNKFQKYEMGSGPFETSLHVRPQALHIEPVRRRAPASHPTTGMPIPPGNIPPILAREEEFAEDYIPPAKIPPPTPIESLLSGDPFGNVRLGDVRAALSIYSYFKRWHDDGLGYPEPDVIGLQDPDRNGQDNLVILGTTTNDRAFAATAWDPRFSLGLGDGNMLFETYASGKRSAVGFGRYPSSCYVLVSRSATYSSHCVTLITGGHPTAVQEVSRLLTKDERVKAEIIAPLGLSGEESFPPDFQLVFEVHLTNDESSVGKISAKQFQTLEKRNVEPEVELKTHTW